MLIYIDESVKEYLETKNDLNCASPLIKALNAMAQSFHDGYHLLSASISSLEFFSQYALLDHIPREVFAFLLKKNYEFDFESLIHKKLVVHISENNEKFKNDYSLNLNECSGRNFRESILVCENILDCELYEHLCRRIMRTKFNQLNLIDIFYRRVGCGGSEAYRTVENELNHVANVLIIMDSDKKFTGDIIGSSANSAQKIVRKYAEVTDNIICLHILNVREKENLIPPSCLLMVEQINSAENLLAVLSQLEDCKYSEEFLRFVDIKSGMKLKEYERFAPTKYNIPLQLICDVINTEHEDKEARIFEGIGSSFVENFCNDVLCGGLKNSLEDMKVRKVPIRSQQKIKNKLDKADKLLELAPAYIKNDWEEIYTRVLQFGCCLSPKLREQILV